MAEVTRYDHGSLSWAELATSDPAAAKKFYAALFGWTFSDIPMGEGPEDTYTLAQIGGQDVGALSPMRPDQKAQGIPPHWLPYVTLKNADQAASQAKSLGGTILAAPMDVMQHGRMSVLQDPTGATFAVWQAIEHIGARRSGEPGTFCWMELLTRDTAAAAGFYAGLFGWAAKPSQFDPSYTELYRGDVPAAGMKAISKDMGEMPPAWGIYWQVADTDSTVATAKTLGATICVGPQDIPNVGRIALLQDVQGASFSVIKLAATA